MSLLFFLINLLVLSVFYTKLKGVIRINAFWFAMFHFFVYAMVGYAFAGDDVVEAAQIQTSFLGLLVFWGFLFGFYLVQGARSLRSSITGVELQALYFNSAVNTAIKFLVLKTVLIGFLFFGGLPPVVASLESIMSGVLDVDTATAVRDFRYQMTKGAYFGESYRGQGLFQAILYFNCSILVSFFSIQYALDKNGRNLCFLMFSIILSFVYVGGIGDRGPFLEVVLIAVCAYSLVVPLRTRSVMMAGVVLFVLMLLLSSLSTKGIHHLQSEGVRGLVTLADLLVDRVFRGNSHYDIAVVELVDSGVWSLRWGSVHLRNVLTSIPGVNVGVPVSYELFVLLNPMSDRTTFYSGTYLTHTYLDFGLLGSVIAFFFCGLFVGVLAKRWDSLGRKSLLIMLAAPSLYFSLGKVVVYGIPGLLPTIAALLIVLTYLRLVFLISRKSTNPRYLN